MKYVKGLDTLRAIAVLSVIVHHYGPSFEADSPAHFIKEVILPDGLFGVNLFFVLSGFLISTILFHEKEVSENKFQSIKNFFIRRALRIFPIYYLTLFVILLFPDFLQVKKDILYYVTYTSNFLINQVGYWTDFGHSWSLAVEEQFYLVCPFILLFTPKRYLSIVFVSFISIGICSSYISLNFNHRFAPILPWNCLDAFGMGGFFAFVLFYKPETIALYQRYSNMTALAAAVFIIYLKFDSYHSGNTYTISSHFLRRSADSIVSIWLICFVLNLKNGFFKAKIIENSAINLIGRVSYGLYMFHYFIPFFYKKAIASFPFNSSTTTFLLNNYYVAYVLKIILLFIISLVSFNYIEKPLLKLKNKFSYSSKRIT